METPSSLVKDEGDNNNRGELSVGVNIQGRKEDLKHILKRGNHKLAQIPHSNTSTLLSKYEQEVENR